MQNTGQGSEKKSYRVVLLLIVGLAAFSSAMKELNQVHELTLQTSQLVARWTDMLPGDTNEMLVKVETCDDKILPPVPPMPALPAVPPVPDIPAVPDTPPVPPSLSDIEIEVPDSPAAPRVPEVPRVKPRRVVRVQREAITASAHASEVKVFVSTQALTEKALKDAFEFDFNQKALKAKNRRQILISPDGRDIILKSLNRSINLRAS
jgi:hypothetical protein